jgi:DNA ligase-1
MRDFARMFEAIDATGSTSEKVAAMASYFGARRDASAAWALYFLSGQRLSRTIGSRVLARWATERSGIPEWLFRDSYAAVGDLAETIALLMESGGAGDTADADDVALVEWVEDRLASLKSMDESTQRERVMAWLGELGRTERFLLIKMMTGAMRVGVSKGLVIKAIAKAAAIPETLVAERLMGEWKPIGAFMQRLMAAAGGGADGVAMRGSGPLPFALASPIEEAVGKGCAREKTAAEIHATLGDIGGWLIEWKWDGIRAQLVRRADAATAIWSRGEEVLTERFPEILAAAARLPAGTVLDGEVLAWRNDRPLPFATMQQRIGRTALSAKVLREAPVAMVAFDVLEVAGEDVRALSLRERRAMLEKLVAGAGSERLRVSEVVRAGSWDEAAAMRAGSRERGVEGMMLKVLDREYVAGRVRGAWWKWKIEPRTFDGVLIYAEPGHGRRASLMTDYTLAVWDGAVPGTGNLVPVAKAYSGLTDAELVEMDAWIRGHSTQRFGVVRGVLPAQVFEIAYEGIARSGRHRGGVAVRFPRIVRWRKDKKAAQAETLGALLALAGGGEAEEPGLFTQG